MKNPELFLEREIFSKQWHLSLHASGQWYLRNRRREVLSWSRPAEQFPGYTRAIGIVLPVGVVHRGDVPPPDVTLVKVSADSHPVIFSLFLEQPGANMNGWPGKKAMGTVLIGRLPLAAGKGTWCVVAHQERFGIDHVKMPRPSDSELERMRGLAEKGELFMTMAGMLDDGAMTLVDLRSDGVELPLT
ncbi:MAG: hypothetical protein ACRDS1_00425 [Pseudonocardiaceae bacterium]